MGKCTWNKSTFTVLDVMLPAFQGVNPKIHDSDTNIKSTFTRSIFFTILKEKKKIRRSTVRHSHDQSLETKLWSMQKRAKNGTRILLAPLRGFSRSWEKPGEPMLHNIFTIKLPSFLIYKEYKFTCLFPSCNERADLFNSSSCCNLLLHLQKLY